LVISPENLTIVALGTWMVTGLAGVNLLRRGGGAYRLRSRPLSYRANSVVAPPRPPRAWTVMVITHITLAVGGLAVLLVYVLADVDALIYADAGLLIIIAAAGVTAVDRWRHAPGRHAAFARSEFPVWSATAHVMAGTATFVIVLLALLADLYGL
jgi:hypothetical protein